MTREDKEIVMNGVHIFSAEVEKDLKVLRDACKRGLRTGKVNPSLMLWLAIRMRQLADALEEYSSDDFTLSDMQDYVE